MPNNIKLQVYNRRSHVPNIYVVSHESFLFIQRNMNDDSVKTFSFYEVHDTKHLVHFHKFDIAHIEQVTYTTVWTSPLLSKGGDK